MVRFGVMALLGCAAVAVLPAESVQITTLSDPPAAFIVVAQAQAPVAPPAPNPLRRVQPKAPPQVLQPPPPPPPRPKVEIQCACKPQGPTTA